MSFDEEIIHVHTSHTVARAGTEWESETSVQAKAGRGGWGTRPVKMIVYDRRGATVTERSVRCEAWSVDMCKMGS